MTSTGGTTRAVTRAGLIAFTAVLIWALTVGTAHATFDSNTINCRGSAVITGDDGTTVRVAATDDEVTLPSKGTARWRGSTSPASTDHHGEVVIDLGISDIDIRPWASANEGKEPSARGVYNYDASDAPPGIYKVTGFHEAAEGECEGEVLVILEGGDGPGQYAAPVGVAVTVLAGMGVVFAGIPKKVV